MRMTLYTTLLMLALSLPAAAQSTYTAHLRRTEAGKGTVIINQSPQIEQLVNNAHAAKTTPASPKSATQRPARTESVQAAKPSTPAAEHHATAKPDSNTPAGHTTAHKSAPAEHKSAPAEHHHATERNAAAAPDTPAEHHNYVNRARYKARGFRICIFTGGNTRADRAKAQQMGQKCRQKFPELASYTSFSAPRWVTYVGDFKTRAEAQKYVRLIRRARFTYEVRIVSSEVNLPID